MKKNVIMIILSMIIVVQFVTIYNTNHSKAVATSRNKAEKNETFNVSNSYLMSNPIDHYYSSKLNSNIEAEVRDTKAAYEKTWEQEYNKVMDIIKNKCIYKKDRNNLNAFKKSIENLIETASPVLETELLNAYEDNPTIPESRGWGNSTFSSLQGIAGQIYRDACMLIIPYLDGDYSFPNMS